MPNYRRKIVIVFLLFCVIGVGIALVFKTSFSTSTVSTNQQTPLCQNSVSFQFLSSSNEVRTITCPTETDSSIDISLSSSASNSSLGLNVFLLTNSSGTISNQTIYSNAGKSVSALLPVSAYGSTIVKITNEDNVNTTLRGYVDVYKSIQTNVVVKNPTHPYRSEGLVVIFGGGVFLFLFGWDPKGFGTKIITSETTSSKNRARGLLKNIWFLRTFSLICGIAISSALLLYTLVFFYTFKLTGDTTSFFPWSWDVTYGQGTTINYLFAVGLITSIAPLTLFIITLFRYVLPKLDKSLKRKGAALYEMEEY